MATAEELAQELLALRESMHTIMARGRLQSVSMDSMKKQLLARLDIVTTQLRLLNPEHAVFGKMPSRAKFQPYKPRRGQF